MSNLSQTRCPGCGQTNVQLDVEAPLVYAHFVACIQGGKLVSVSPPRTIWTIRRGHELTLAEGSLRCQACGTIGNPTAFGIQPTNAKVLDVQDQVAASPTGRTAVRPPTDLGQALRGESVSVSWADASAQSVDDDELEEEDYDDGDEDDDDSQY